jgi:hypothetical protein
MSNKYTFLAGFYFKNLVTMKFYGGIYSHFLEHTKERWQNLYESVKGKDTWLVIGNGPSLRVEDLEAFQRLGIPSIASNKINILFNKTDWRPTLYTIADPLLLHKLPPEFYSNIDLILLPHTHVLMARTKKLLPWRHIKDAAGEKKYLVDKEAFSPLNGLFVGWTITCPNIELAIWAGAKTIYVIGCDHFYAHEDSNAPSKRAEHFGVSNHFDPNYRKPGEIVNKAPVQLMNRAYDLMRKMADERGVRIVNVSRKTALEAFERDTVENALASLAG